MLILYLVKKIHARNENLFKEYLLRALLKTLLNIRKFKMQTIIKLSTFFLNLKYLNFHHAREKVSPIFD